MVEYKAGCFAISCGPRICHFVNLNLKIEIQGSKEYEDVVRVNQRKVDSSASDLSNFLD